MHDQEIRGKEFAGKIAIVAGVSALDEVLKHA